MVQMFKQNYFLFFYIQISYVTNRKKKICYLKNVVVFCF